MLIMTLISTTQRISMISLETDIEIIMIILMLEMPSIELLLVSMMIEPELFPATIAELSLITDMLSLIVTQFVITEMVEMIEIMIEMIEVVIEMPFQVRIKLNNF